MFSRLGWLRLGLSLGLLSVGDTVSTLRFPTYNPGWVLVAVDAPLFQFKPCSPSHRLLVYTLSPKTPSSGLARVSIHPPFRPEVATKSEKPPLNHSHNHELPSPSRWQPQFLPRTLCPFLEIRLERYAKAQSTEAWTARGNRKFGNGVAGQLS